MKFTDECVIKQATLVDRLIKYGETEWGIKLLNVLNSESLLNNHIHLMIAVYNAMISIHSESELFFEGTKAITCSCSSA